MSTKIKWKRGTDGYVDSHCGRFMICPLPMGTMRAQGYVVHGPNGWKADGDTQAIVKAEAEEWLQRKDQA